MPCGNIAVSLALWKKIRKVSVHDMCGIYKRMTIQNALRYFGGYALSWSIMKKQQDMVTYIQTVTNQIYFVYVVLWYQFWKMAEVV